MTCQTRNSVQKPTKKEDRVILRVFEKYPRLSLRVEQAVLRKKGLNISCDYKKTFTGS